MIRAKFKCTSVTKFEGGSEEVALAAVTAGSDENKQWAKWTPSGSLKMHITADGAIGKFEAGKEYFLDFTAA